MSDHTLLSLTPISRGASPTLPERVFDQGDPRQEGGIFHADADRRRSWLHSWAEDAERDLRTSVEVRDRQRSEAARGHHHATERAPERAAAVEHAEKSAIRHAAGLVAQMARFANPEVFANEVSVVLTEADLDTLIHTLSAVRAEKYDA